MVIKNSLWVLDFLKFKFKVFFMLLSFVDRVGRDNIGFFIMNLFILLFFEYDIFWF